MCSSRKYPYSPTERSGNSRGSQRQFLLGGGGGVGGGGEEGVISKSQFHREEGGSTDIFWNYTIQRPQSVL